MPTTDSKDTNSPNSLNSPIQPLIIGGGISGLATAAALKQITKLKSNSYQILEQMSQSDFTNINAGAGAQLGPNGLKALRAIGGETLMKRVMEEGSYIRGNAIILPGVPEPMLVPDLTEEECGLPQVFIRWGVLRSILFELVDSECICTDVGGDICGYTVNDDGTVRLLSSGDPTPIPHNENSNLIISADGVRSTFRYLVNNQITKIDPNDDDDNDDVSTLLQTELKETGRVNIKCIVPTNMDSSTFKEGYTYAWFGENGGIGCFAGPAGDGYSYWAISIADTINEETGETQSFVSTATRVKEVEDLSSIQSRLLTKLKDLNTKDCQFVIDLVEQSTPERILVSRSEEAITIGPSLQQDGKVVLVGDSAHAMSLSYGQQPNFALEDAVVLASCLRDCESVEEALEMYSRKRVSRCIEMQERSAERAAKAMKGETTEDVSKWIFQWDIDD